MTTDELQLLKAFSGWLEQFTEEALAIREREQAILDKMPAGLTEVKLHQRVEHLHAASGLMGQARMHLVEALRQQPNDHHRKQAPMSEGRDPKGVGPERSEDEIQRESQSKSA